MNECLNNNTCSLNENCQNTFGSFICVCKPGFSKFGLNSTCIDINEYLSILFPSKGRNMVFLFKKSN
jgi:hypothetical protein